jgi:LPXTG-motif cell wall-anchored protein
MNGSWSKRGVSAGTVSINPVAFTRVAVLARANVLLTKMTGAETTKGTAFGAKVFQPGISNKTLLVAAAAVALAGLVFIFRKRRK